MITLIFEAHGTTIDNENHLSSGWYDDELSELGKKQSEEMGERYKNDQLDAIFCSDLKRAVQSAEIAFKDRNIPIIPDERLRECNYGELNHHPETEVNPQKIHHIVTPFPNGESYEDTLTRVKSFLEYLLSKYDGKRVMVIDHRATQYGLEYWINGISLHDSITNHEKWKWQPGWTYTLKEI